MVNIEYYKFEDGSNPIDPYLDSLDTKMRAKVLRRSNRKHLVKK